MQFSYFISIFVVSPPGGTEFTKFGYLGNGKISTAWESGGNQFLRMERILTKRPFFNNAKTKFLVAQTMNHGSVLRYQPLSYSFTYRHKTSLFTYFICVSKYCPFHVSRSNSLQKASEFIAVFIKRIHGKSPYVLENGFSRGNLTILA